MSKKINTYYDGAKLLSMKDLNGNVPELYLCTTNRTGGKTTFFSRLCVNRFLKNKEKFIILYRYKYELDNVADKFFKDIKLLFFNDYNMTYERKASGVFCELFIYKHDDIENKVSCGYALTLNSADQIKKYSHFFSDVARILFDEFQSETNHYCSNEISKFISVHTSVARGRGKQVRYVPVYMLSNAVSLINPYYTELGISERLQADTKFLRGDGFVLEQGYISNASEAQKNSGFNKAFSRNKYVEYSSQNIYLNDSKSFIESVKGKNKYLATIKFENKEYAIREYPELGIIYCDDNVDKTFPNKLAVTTDDHNINYVMLKNNIVFISIIRYYFDNGCFRFKDLKCKQAILKAISY